MRRGEKTGSTKPEASQPRCGDVWNVTRVPWDQAALAGLDRARGEGRGAVEERKEVLSAGVVVKQFAPVGTVPFHGEIVPSMAWRGRGYVTAPCPRTPKSTKKGPIGRGYEVICLFVPSLYNRGIRLGTLGRRLSNIYIFSVKLWRPSPVGAA